METLKEFDQLVEESKSTWVPASDKPLAVIRERLADFVTHTPECMGEVWENEDLMILVKGLHGKTVKTSHDVTTVLNYFVLGKLRNRLASGLRMNNNMTKGDNQRINVILRTTNVETQNKRMLALIHNHFEKMTNFYLARYDKRVVSIIELKDKLALAVQKTERAKAKK